MAVVLLAVGCSGETTADFEEEDVRAFVPAVNSVEFGTFPYSSVGFYITGETVNTVYPGAPANGGVLNKVNGVWKLTPATKVSNARGGSMRGIRRGWHLLPTLPEEIIPYLFQYQPRRLLLVPYSNRLPTISMAQAVTPWPHPLLSLLAQMLCLTPQYTCNTPWRRWCLMCSMMPVTLRATTM